MFDALGIPNDDHCTLGSGQHYIHSISVVEEPYIAIVVGTHQRDQHYVTFLALE